MKEKWLLPKLMLVVVVLLLVQLACLPGGTNPDVEPPAGPDYAATEAALQKTQAALDAAAQQPEPQQPEPQQPVQPTNTPEPPPPTKEPVVLLPQMNAYPEGQTIYYTDFDSTGDIEPGWSDFAIPSDLRYTVSMNSGFIRVEVPDQYSSVYLVYEDMFFDRNNADVYVETRFQNMGTHNINNISVFCRGTDQGWYEFSMLSGGLWYIWKYDASKGDYKLIKDGGIPNLNYDAPHSIGAECRGNYLTFYFDGERLKNATITDSQFIEGQTGIAVYADDWENVVVEFDYFAIAVPTN